MQGWNNEKKQPIARKRTLQQRITENMSPRGEGKSSGVVGTRLITQLDKFAVYGMFEK